MLPATVPPRNPSFAAVASSWMLPCASADQLRPRHSFPSICAPIVILRNRNRSAVYGDPLPSPIEPFHRAAMTATDTVVPPSLAAIRVAAAAIAPHINRTPVQRWRDRELAGLIGDDTEVFLKLELFQRTGSFKVRGVLTNMLAMA